MIIEPPIVPTPHALRRTPTESVDHALELALETDGGSEVDQIIDSLTEEGRQLFFDMIDIANRGQLGQIDDLWKIDYIRRPPTMKEFIDDDYWLGQTTRKTSDNPGIFPKWKEILTNDFDLDSSLHNVVVTGSLGCGKSWVSCVIILYRLTIARLLKNPQHFFGLSKGSKIYYSILSITTKAVRETVFGDAINFMSNSPFFTEECHFNPDMQYTNNVIPMGMDICINAGSKGWHVIGKNMMAILLDEGNFRLEANPNVKAYKLYEEVRSRIKNRFEKKAGYLPAISILSSSAADESSFTEQVISQINLANEPTKQKVYRHAIYHIKELELPERWFKVAYGLKNIDPTVLSGWYTKKGDKIEDTTAPHENPPPGAGIELVPSNFHAEYKRNTRFYLMSMSGISIGGSHRLFSSIIDIERCIAAGEQDGLKNPANLAMMPISDEDDRNIWDYLDHPKFLTRRLSQVVPLRHPEAQRFGHVDLATQTMAGIGICHLVGSTLVSDIKDGRIFQEYRLIVEYDFILTIIAGKTKPINLEKIQNFFFWLRDWCGYRFGKVTCDQWQSANLLQMMERRGFKTDVLSMDRKKDQYYALRDGFQEQRIRMYRQEQFLLEAEKLMDLPQKVDHDPDGSKDTADAVGGCYHNAITSENIVSASVVGSEATIFNDSAFGPGGIDEKPPIVINIPLTNTKRPNSVFVA